MLVLLSHIHCECLSLMIAAFELQPVLSFVQWQDADALNAEGRPRTRMVVLGSGWGAINFLRHLDPKLTSCKPSSLWSAPPVKTRKLSNDTFTHMPMHDSHMCIL